MTATAVGYLSVHRETRDFDRRPGPADYRATDHQRQDGYRPAETAGYPGGAGPYGPGPGPETDWFEDQEAATGDSLWDAGQVLAIAQDEAAQVAQAAQAKAAATRDAAEREAAAIREAAEREAADLRARLDSMLGDLGQVVAAYVADNLAITQAPSTAPPTPKTESSRPKELPGAPPTRPAAEQLPGAPPTRPAAKPARPEAGPGASPDAPAVPRPSTATRPAQPRTAPAGPRTAPAGPRTAPARASATPKSKPATTQNRAGRQKSAWRFAKWGTAALLTFAIGASAVEIGEHGYGFFVFRENGQGDTPSVQPGRAGSNETDAQFLAQQAAAKAKAGHHAPVGRHAKTSPSSKGTTAASTTGG